MAAAVLFFSLLILIFIGVPISISLMLSSALTIFAFGTATPLFQVRSIVTAVSSYPLLAIPLFILAGELMSTGGISKRLIKLADVWLCNIKADLAYVTVAASTFYAAISGSAPPTVAAIGSNVIPEMEKRGYPREYSTGLAVSAGMVGVLIPPSIPFVMYGISSGESVSTLFMAGVIPGLLFSFVFCIIARILYKRQNIVEIKHPFNLKTALRASVDGIWAILAPIIVLGGIYGGYFSPFIYREMNFKQMVDGFVRATKTTATCMGLVAFASTFGRLMTLEQVPNLIASFITGISTNRYVVLLLINLFLIVVGMFFETTAAIIILTPILVPIVTAVGINPIHFGVILTANLAVGFVTPPLGVDLFVGSGISGLKVEKVIQAVIPYMIGMFVYCSSSMFSRGLACSFPTCSCNGGRHETLYYYPGYGDHEHQGLPLDYCRGVSRNGKGGSRRT